MILTKNLTKLLPILFLFIILADSKAFCQNVEPSTVMDTIVISADRTQETKREVTSNISVIDQKAIEQSASKNVGQLLRKSGIAVREYSGLSTQLSMRGFLNPTSSNDIENTSLVLMNGRRVGIGELSVLGLDNIDRVEIIRGPAAVQYGSAAMGGIVNIITRTGISATDFFRASMELGIGSFGYSLQNLSLSGQKSGFDFSGSVTETMMSNDYRMGNGEIYYYTRYKRRISTNFDFGYTFNKLHRVGINARYFRAFANGTPNRIDSTNYRNAMKYNYAGELNYSGGTDDQKFNWQFSFSQAKHLSRLNPAAGGPYTESYNDSQNGQAQLSWTGDILKLTGGIDYIWYDFHGQSHPGASDPEDSKYRDIATFLMARLNLLDQKLILTAGARYDKYDVDMVDGQSKDETHLAPSIGLAYFPLDFLKLRVHVAQGYKMPTAQQLTGNYYNSANVHIVGNPDLVPETSLSYEGGFDIFLNYLTLSATYFNSDYENMILQKTLTSSERTFENVETAKMSGLEFELNFDIGSFLGYDFSLRPYANMTRIFSAKNKTQNTYLQNIAKYTIGYGLDLDFPEQHLSIDIHGNYSGHEYVRDYAYLIFPRSNPFGWVSGHNTFDISLQKRIISFEDKGRLELKVRVENVFDKFYQPVPYFPQPGRNFYVGLRYVY